MKFTIPMIPKAQMRARHGRTKSGFSVTFKDAVQRGNEAHLICVLEQHRPAQPFEGAVTLGVRAYLPIPASWPKKKRAEAAAGQTRPTSKPDLDNLIKNIKDCLTALNFWQDDRQVVEYLPGTGKYYDDGGGPRWEIEIKNARLEAATSNRANSQPTEQKGIES